MTRFTIAYSADSGALLACVPDGDRQQLGMAIARTLAMIGDQGEIEVESGLVLVDELSETDEVIFSGHSVGWLRDEHAVPFQHAVRATPRSSR